MNYNDIEPNNIVYKKSSGRKRKAIVRKCNYCDEEYKARIDQLKLGRAKFCSTSCSMAYRNMVESAYRMKKERGEANNIKWNQGLGYSVGLIVSDGNLSKARRRIRFTSKDKELVQQFKSIIEHNYINRQYDIIEHNRGGSKWFVYQFSSGKLYYFLKSIGVHPNKSKTISKVDIPDHYFPDFLRGEIDGDGGFYNKGNKIETAIFSGSYKFLKYLKGKINELITNNSQGSLHKGSGCYNLRFSVKDSQKIYKSIYHNDCKFFLKRKRNTIEEFFNSYSNQSKFNRSRVCVDHRKISYQDGLDIIKQYFESDLSMRDIASEYSISAPVVCKIINLDHWSTEHLA